MKKWTCLIVLVSVVLMLTGCSSMVFERHTLGKSDPFSRTWDYSSADFEVLGPVEATGESTVLLGLVARGTEGYGLLMKEARKIYGKDVSTVMFIFSDYSYEGLFYPIIGSVKTSYSGTAVKAKTVSHANNVRVKD